MEERMDDEDLIASFESLGGGKGRRQDNGLGGGCEFGIFQSRHKVANLGLLRWGTIELDGVIRGVESKFDRLGLADTIELQPQGHPDWRIMDLAYGTQIDHSDLDRDKVTAADALPIICKRLLFLRDKLMEDLRLGEKTFVYRLADSEAIPGQIDRLAAAIRGCGPGNLLFVLQDGGVAGHFRIEAVHDGLIVARMNTTGTPNEAINFLGWLDLCRFAHDQFRAQQRGPVAQRA